MKPKRLPNGFGQISKLSGRRSRPYMVRTTDQKIIGYAPTYEDAYMLLCEYNRTPWNIELQKATVKDVWDIFCETEMERLATNTQRNLKYRFKHLKPIENKEYASLKTYHFITFLNSLEVSENIRNQIIALLKHLDNTAYQLDIISKKYAHELKGKGVEVKNKRTNFTEKQIETLWEHQDEDFVDYILILIYTGFRANEFINLKPDNFNLENWTITAGSKTKAGKNRIVPIHKRIRPLVLSILDRAKGKKFYPLCYDQFNLNFKTITKDLCGRAFVPHEARHTLRTRLDRVGANKVSIDRILGHKTGDTGEDIYTHKSIEELHEAIALLP